MSKRAIIIIVSISVVVIVGIVIGAMSLGNLVGSIFDGVGDVMKEGSAYGAASNTAACVNQTLQNLTGCKSAQINCRLKQEMFLKSCLSSAPVSPGFCDGVPPSSEIVKSAKWALIKCTPHSKIDKGLCEPVMDKIQEFCKTYKPAEQAPAPTSPTTTP